MTWEMFGRWVFAAIIKYMNIHAASDTGFDGKGKHVLQCRLGKKQFAAGPAGHLHGKKSIGVRTTYVVIDALLFAGT